MANWMPDVAVIFITDLFAIDPNICKKTIFLEGDPKD